MGLFDKNKEGGLISDVIRCDEKEYLVWKWSPRGVPSKRENAIRNNSKLHVGNTQVAVFVYQKEDGTQMEFIKGPKDTTLETANLPVLSGILGAMYGGDSPFPAEIYFINLAGNISVPFYIPKFDVADKFYAANVVPGNKRSLYNTVPVSVKGTILMNITDYKAFIDKHSTTSLTIDEFFSKMKAAVSGNVKSAVATFEKPLLEIESAGIDDTAELIENKLRTKFEEDYGVNLMRLEIESITLDKDSRGYAILLGATSGQFAVDTDERMKMDRQKEFRRENLAMETEYFAAHSLNRQADVAEKAAENLGKTVSGVFGSGTSKLSPTELVAGMMIGGAVGQNMAGMMNTMMGGMQGQVTPPVQQTPPPIVQTVYYVAQDGQRLGPFGLHDIKNMIADGRITRKTQVWKTGMSAWAAAENINDLLSIFTDGTLPPPIPATPPEI